MPKLEKLVLGTNQIGDEGAVALAEAVGKGALPELKGLYLGNQIGDEGAKALAEAVGKDACRREAVRRQPERGAGWMCTCKQCNLHWRLYTAWEGAKSQDARLRGNKCV